MNSKEWRAKINQDDLYGSLWHDLVSDLERAEKALEETQWISVKDRMPEEEQRVLYYFAPVGMHTGRYKKTEHGNVFYGAAGWLTDDVTHWMPLPELPKPT